jgi:hypothetical protein
VQVEFSRPGDGQQDEQDGHDEQDEPDEPDDGGTRD